MKLRLPTFYSIDHCDFDFSTGDMKSRDGLYNSHFVLHEDDSVMMIGRDINVENESKFFALALLNEKVMKDWVKVSAMACTTKGFDDEALNADWIVVSHPEMMDLKDATYNNDYLYKAGKYHNIDVYTFFIRNLFPFKYMISSNGYFTIT